MNLIKIEAGRVKTLNAKGDFYFPVGEINAQEAQIIDEKYVSITYWNGKTKLYDREGRFLKII